MEEQKKSSGFMWIIIVIVILAVVGLAYAFVFKKPAPATVTQDDTTTLPPPKTDTTGTTTTEIPPADNKSVYKDGTYTAIGNYNSPGGSEQIKVTVTLQNDVITDAQVASAVTSGPQAIFMQGQFISGFKAQVIGKNIVDVKLSRVSGSSLTPKGWNDAISKIESQAKV